MTDAEAKGSTEPANSAAEHQPSGKIDAASSQPTPQPTRRPKPSAAEHALAPAGTQPARGEASSWDPPAHEAARSAPTKAGIAAELPVSSASPSPGTPQMGVEFPPAAVGPEPQLLPDRQLFRQRRARPLLGPSLWIGGALLWAYVVMGEWVVTIELPEVVGWLVVLLAYAGSWTLAVRRSNPDQRRPLHTILPGIAGFFGFAFAVVFTASVLGGSSRKQVAAVTVMLWFVAVAMFAAGRRLTQGRRGRLEGWQRAGLAALWVVSGLGTLVSLLAAMERA